MGCCSSKAAPAKVTETQPTKTKGVLSPADPAPASPAAPYLTVGEATAEIKASTTCAECAVPLYDQVFGGIDAFKDKPAFCETVGEKERTLTFGELRDRVRAVGKGLIARGDANHGDIIGVYSANCIDWVTVAHAAMLVGLTVAPINPTYEVRELMHHLTEATSVADKQMVRAIYTIPIEPFKARATEAAKEYAEKYGLSEPLPIVYLMGGDLEKIIEEGKDVDEAALEAKKAAIQPKKTIALLPSSSGTTGPPKCVMLTHASIATNTLQTKASLGYSTDDCTVAFLPFFHMFGLIMFVTFSVMSGMKTVIMAKFDPKQYLGLIAAHKPTILHVVPPVANALGKMAPAGSLDCVKCVLCAAAPLSKDQEDALQLKLPNGIVHQGYGMTELSPVATFAAVVTEKQIAEVKARSGTIGTLVSSTAARLVKVEGEEDPCRGLLHIKGPQVMQGYRGREEQTKATISKDGWLDTGDVAVVDPQGYFWIVDRVKELIKVQGFQVAPAELEGLLNQHGSVKECCVIGVPNDRMGEAPKAFVSLNPGVEMSAEELYKALDEHLEAVGTQKQKRLKGGVEIVKDIVKTASGKLLRKDYRAIEKKRREAGEAPPPEVFVPAQ